MLHDLLAFILSPAGAIVFAFTLFGALGIFSIFAGWMREKNAEKLSRLIGKERRAFKNSLRCTIFGF